MDVVVLAKDVPNPGGEPPEIGPDFRLRRDGVDGALDSSDEPGIALAVRLAREHGGRVTALCAGPPAAARALRRALALGADEGVLISDPALAGADALATATVLAAALVRRRFDLVLAGVESSDGATGTMPMTLAELLGLPCATFARALTIDAGRAHVERQTDEGWDELECDVPLVVTLTAAAQTPRQPTLKETMAAKRAPLEQLALADLDLTGVPPGAHTVTAIEIAPARAAGELVDASEASARIAELIGAA
jgi:electron transfer flavoprotein beta subunit